MLRPLYLFVFIACTFFSLSVLVQAEAISANEAQLERAVAEVSGSVLSPYCPGRLLRDCPSSAARGLKEKIRELLKSGKSRDEVIEELLAMHGEDIRAAPLMSGFGLWAWVVPFVFLLGGLAFVIAWLRSRQLDEGDLNPVVDTSIDERYKKQIERELSR